MKEENKSLSQDLDECFAAKKSMQSRMNDSTDYVMEMEEKVFKSNKISLELLK